MSSAVTADEAAAFAVWLRDSFAPAPDLVRFVGSLAMANGEDAPSPLPAEGGREDIGDLLRRHLSLFHPLVAGETGWSTGVARR